MKKKILIISYHFYPNTSIGSKRPSELAISLLKEGHDVTVICAKDEIDPTLVSKLKGLKIIKIPVPPKFDSYLIKSAKAIKSCISPKSKKASKLNDTDSEEQTSNTTTNDTELLLQKMRRWYLSMSTSFDSLKLWLAFIFLVLIYKRFSNTYDTVITSGPPMAAHAAGIFTKLLFKCNWCLDLRDPFPISYYLYTKELTVEQTKIMSAFRKKIDMKFEAKCVQRSNLIVTASPGIKKDLISRYNNIQNKIETVYNGYDFPLETQDTQKNSKLTLIYAGTLYLKRNPFPLLQAIKKLTHENRVEANKVCMNFYGYCHEWNGHDMQKWVDNNNLNNIVTINPPVNSTQILDIMRNSDVLINFCQGQPRQIPGKTFDYIGLGKKVLVFTEHDSDTAALIKESNTGIVIDSDTDTV